MGKYKALNSELAVLTKNIDAMSKNKSEKGLVAELFDCDDESLSFEDEVVTKFKAFMVIVKDEPVVGKDDARSDYTYVDLYYVEDQRKKLLSGRRKRKETISSKVNESPSKTIPEIASNFESKCENQELLHPLPNLSRATPIGTSNNVIPLVVLNQTTTVPEKAKKVVDKELVVKIVKKNDQTKSTFIPDPILVKKADSSTKQLLHTLMEEVKRLKEQIKPPSDNFATVSQTGSSKSAKGKQNTWFGPCKHCVFRNHLLEDCYNKPKRSTYQSTDHLTKEHLEQVVVKKTLAKLKAQSSHASSLRKAPKIPKPFILCKYCEFNDHHSIEYEYYPGCDICGSIAPTTDCFKKTSSNNKKPRIAN
nr:hypothetical protein [Tanacetum cinerariifolium]